MNKLENVIKSLTSLSYFDWIKVRNTIDRLFGNKIHDAKRDIHITEKDLENIKMCIRDRSNCGWKRYLFSA